MAIPGQRFHIDLDSDEETDGPKAPRPAFAGGFPKGLVEDVKEKLPSNVRIPSPPRIKSSETGFPTHRRRPKPSTFKQSRGKKSQNDGLVPQDYTQNGDLISHRPPPPSNHVSSAAAPPDSIVTREVEEHQRINEENKQRLASMSSNEIEEARKELMTGLSPSLIERLLKKANIDEGRNDSRTELEPSQPEEPLLPTVKKSHTKKVTFEEPKNTKPPSPPQITPHLPPHNPEDLQPASIPLAPQPLPPRIHFPPLPAAPDLDPSDPDFLKHLHQTYFPSLPANPSALSWMTPISPTSASPYSPTHSSLPPSALRFDFRGHLLPPRLSTQLSPALGLHHHGDAPEAAGYTIPELAYLARSAFPAQRCIAYQTLGRILYRLGRGDFGDQDDDLAEGLWELMERGRVVEGMVEEAGRGGESGNRSVWVTATEAVWLWRKGGGRRWGAK